MARKLNSIQEHERKAIASQLHDDVGQNITAMKLNIKAIETTPLETKQSSIVDNLKTIAERMHNATYELLSMLRPTDLQKLGLSYCLSKDYFAELFGNDIVFYYATVTPSVDSLPDWQQLLLYRIANEAITNSLRHANAQRVWLDIRDNDNKFSFCIHDDGLGFDPSMTESSYGLMGIKEKALALVGDYEMVSSIRGTEHCLRFYKDKE